MAVSFICVRAVLVCAPEGIVGLAQPFCVPNTMTDQALHGKQFRQALFVNLALFLSFGFGKQSRTLIHSRTFS